MITLVVMKPEHGDLPSQMTVKQVSDYLKSTYKKPEFGFATFDDGTVIKSGDIAGIGSGLDSKIASKDGQTLRVIPKVAGG